MGLIRMKKLEDGTEVFIENATKKTKGYKHKRLAQRHEN